METIRLLDLLPAPFEDRRENHRDSDVWLTDVRFRSGHRYMIDAPSGTGKSSLCSFIYGLRTDYLGQIMFDGTDIRNLGQEDWSLVRRTSLAYLPQQMELFDELTVMENIQLKNSLTNHLSISQIEQLLERAGIGSKRNEKVGRLSIGQQQRVAIIRSLAQPMRFLLMDEPVSHLDMENNAIMAGMINETLTRENAALITTSVGNPLAINDLKTLKL
ncbi:MAG: ATP-binding cassette domain-containing protein [Muribaculaceae bacterium]|nr:ATP-binding cassette domain-containing protein [Muribaculaceae bacterium]